MRIVISALPKSGNHWIKCLLSTIYGLEWISGDDTPDTNAGRFRGFVEAGRFPDNTIFHQHCRYKEKLCDVIDAIPAHHVTIVRDPYDAFISLYYWEQERSSRNIGGHKRRPRSSLDGKPLDDEAVLRFLSDDFGRHIARANAWLHSGRVIPVRYEELHSDSTTALKRVTEQIEPVPVETIAAAIEACRAENMRQQGAKMAWHVRAAKVGDSRGKLGEAHLDIFRELHGQLIRSLGYEVR